METSYLPLTDYSTKYKVSISTLRRRIKANDIEYRFDQGKYFVLDHGLERPSPKIAPAMTAIPQRPSLAAKSSSALLLSKSEKDFLASSSVESFSNYPSGLSMSSASPKSDEPILTAANRLLTELKKAYTQILQEKEEQILHLREEVTDLKTLVRVLESQNERMKSKI